MKKIIKLTTLILTVFLAFGCDYSQLENKLNDLEGRITALEESVSAVNANAIALRAIMKEGIRIVGFTALEHGYKLSLSDGTVVDVIYGTTAPGIIPTIGINADGKWVMSLDGENFTVIQGAQLVDAEDGLAPQVRVSSGGFWQVSIDGGKTWSDILGADGKPVSAVDGAAAGGIWTIFRDVTVDADRQQMVFILATDGSEERVPIVDNFDMQLDGNSEGA